LGGGGKGAGMLDQRALDARCTAFRLMLDE
jgi:hypothetical protein